MQYPHIPILNRNYIFKWSVFHCQILPGCNNLVGTKCCWWTSNCLTSNFFPLATTTTGWYKFIHNVFPGKNVRFQTLKNDGNCPLFPSLEFGISWSFQGCGFSPIFSGDKCLVGGWTNPCEKYYIVKLEIFPNFRGENSKNIWVATT